MLKKKSISPIIIVFMILIFLSNNENVYADNDAYVKLISSEKIEKPNQEGLSAQEVLIRVVGATFKDDIDYTNYTKAFTVVKAPPGYGIAMAEGAVEVVSPQVIKVRIRGVFPLLEDCQFVIKFKETALNENDISIADDGIVAIDLKKEPSVEFKTSNIIYEEEVKNGLHVYGTLSNLPIISTSSGKFKSTISQDDLMITGLPEDYKPYVKYKSDTEFYFTIIPKEESPLPLEIDYDECSVSVKASAYKEDIKIESEPIGFEMKHEKSKELNVTIDLDDYAVIQYDLFDKNGRNIGSGTKSCEIWENEINIDISELNRINYDYYIVFRKLSSFSSFQKTTAAFTIKHENKELINASFILPETIEKDANIKWESPTEMFKLIKNEDKEYKIDLINQNNVSINLNAYEEKEMKSGNKQSKDKILLIKFNSKINLNGAVYKNIHVIEDNDTYKTRKNIFIEYKKENPNYLFVYPTSGGWTQGKTYYILIDKGIESLDGEILGNKIKAIFQVEE